MFSFASIGRRETPKCNIFDCRTLYFGDRSETYLVMKDTVEHVLSLMKESEGDGSTGKDGEGDTQESLPAIDVGCGPGLFVVAYAKAFPRLRWYPSDLERELPIELLPTLDFFLSDTKPQFTDSNGKSVYVGDSVVLEGLSNKQFNDQQGILTGADSKSPGRFGVCLGEDPNGKTISLKECNIVQDGRAMGEVPSSATSQKQGQRLLHVESHIDRGSMLQGLRQRAFALDILDRESFGTILTRNQLQGRAKILTCSHLLSMIGYRAGIEAPKMCLCLAHEALVDGGYLITMDTTDYGDFYGNSNKMEEYVRQSGLGLSNVALPKKIAKKLRAMGTNRKIMIWKRGAD